LFRAHQGESGPRQEVVVEGAVGAAALDPGVAGAQPVAQVDEHRDLVGSGVETVAAGLHPLAPAPLQGHCRDTVRQLAPLPVMDRPRHVDGREDRVVRFEGAEDEGIEEDRRGLGICCVARRAGSG
jgi:hypothetical protein